MKKMLCAGIRTKIIMFFGYMLFGLYAEANQLNIVELKEDITSEKQILSEDQVLYMKSDKAKRNGFVTVKLTPACSYFKRTIAKKFHSPFKRPSFSMCDFDFSTDYGVVFGKSNDCRMLASLKEN